ncbi:MAG: serine hydrolase [Phycisphaeraceae bacterium]|nr:serine hydrolase [Phycisphaeraceae bacterium]
MKMNLLTVSACLTILLAANASHADPYQERLDELIQPYLDGEYIVGLSVGIITAEGQHTYHFGETKRGGKTPDDGTLYEIGSISKTMTGLLLADGVIRGLYDIDAPVSTLLAADSVKIHDGVTLRRLSMHTSGLPRMPTNFMPCDPNDPFATYTEERLLAYLQDPKMQSEPGTEASYSNLGVGLLGYALAKQAQMPFEDLLRKRVLTPLGMDDTTVRLRDVHQPHMASPHTADAEPAHLWTIETLAGAGGVRSNIQDMLTYAAAQLDPDSTPLAKAIRLCQSDQNPADEPAKKKPMGLGWFIVDEGAALIHSGQTGGFKAGFMVSPSKQVAVVVLSNTSNPSVSELGRLITRLAAGKEISPKKPPIPAKVEPEVMKAYAGRYLALGMLFEIEYIDGKLYAQLNSQPRFRLFPEDDDTFRYRVVEASIDFERDDTGVVSKLTLHQNGRDHVCVRLADEEAEPASNDD